jgi:hypothetical protein
MAPGVTTLMVMVKYKSRVHAKTTLASIPIIVMEITFRITTAPANGMVYLTRVLDVKSVFMVANHSLEGSVPMVLANEPYL